MFEYFRKGFGLVTEHDPLTENCNLFLAVWHILKKDSLTEADRTWFMESMTMKKNAKGLYNRRSEESEPVRSMSQDEILGFLISSNILVTPNGQKVWDHLITHFGTYNNTGRLSEYIPYNPANFYSWGQIMGSKLSYLFLPFYVANLLIAIHKDAQNTSSKIMDWMEFQVMPKTWINKILYKIYEKQMKKQYGENYISVMLHIYHNAESAEFPIFKELN
jgi:hypothetical protein